MSFVLVALGITAKGQTPFFSPQNIAPEALSSQQRVIYDKAVNFGSYTDFQIGHVNPISSCLYQDSFLNVQANGLACHNTAQFVTRNLEYKADNDFYWYGKFTYLDSSSGCYKGDAMFFTETGKYYGYFIINNQNYELIDLTGGLQILAQVDMILANKQTCGTSSAERPAQAYNDNGPGGWGGYQCKPKVLMLFTQDAFNSDPMGGNGRAALCYNQTRQALLNSGVSPFKLNIDYVVDVVNYTTPPYFDPAHPSTTGMSKVIDDMTSPNNPLSYDLSYKQYIHKADLVILFVQPMNAEYIAGQSLMIGDPPNLQNGSLKPYAAVQRNYATIAGYTFAHELGHLMGGRHANEGLVINGADYTSGLGHAHKWTYRTSTGWWPFINYYDNPGYSIGYQGTATINEVILGYSNPLAYDHGQPTGRAGDRNAADLYWGNGCTIANYNPEPDPFAIAVTGGASPNSTYKGEFAGGRYYFCSGREIVLSSWVTGPQGNYTYLWEYSHNGINWFYLANTVTTPTSWYIPPGVGFADANYRLTVTSPTGAIKEYYYPIRFINCPYFNLPYRLASPANGTDLDQLVASDSYSVSPNPANDYLIANLQLVAETSIKFLLVDMLGRQTILLEEMPQDKGSHKVSLNVSAVPAGVYQLIYQHGGQREVQKVSIVR